MNLRVLGSLLLITGMSIGGGLLALPVATAAGGALKSSILLVIIWILTLGGALFTLEVSLWLPEDTNLVSMAKHTLGKGGSVICWIAYLALLYTLLCVYLSAGTGLFSSIFNAIWHWHNDHLSSVLFVVVFGAIVWCGIHLVDKTNRLFMSIKILLFVLLAAMLIPLIDPHKYIVGSTQTLIMSGLMTIVFSFGYSIIIPSLRTYLAGNVTQLRFAVIAGSLIPLICYVIWISVVQGTLGYQTLQTVSKSSSQVASLTQHLSDLGKHWIPAIAHGFSWICILTAFLSVSLALSDFISDGCNLRKQGKQKKWVYILTFIPPLLIILYYPSAFRQAINFAGIFCAIILILLPAAMVWSGRYCKKIATGYRVAGGKLFVSIILLLSTALLLFSVFTLQI